MPRGAIALGALMAIGVLLAVVGWTTAALVWFAASLLINGAVNLRYLHALNHWAALPRQRPLPGGIGAWRQVFDRLGRFARAEASDREEAASEIDRMRAAVDLLPDALVVMDRYDIVQWCNRAASELHGIVELKRPIDHFIRQPEFTRFLEIADFRSPVTLSLPTRPGRLFQMRMVPTPDSWRLLVTRDITEAAKLDAMRRDFVANVSHEIRTPLTVVAGFIETLIDLDLSRAEQVEYLNTARKQTVTMRSLLEDLLTLSSLENATREPDGSRFALAPLLAAQVADANSLSAGRHRIGLQCPPDAELTGAATEIESAIRNLLTNAIRYTPEGGTITVRFERRAHDALLSVEDTGIGVAPEHLPRLSERFYRVDRGRSRETGGTGLGLAIVKHIAQRHGAQLRIDSTLGRGSRFAIEFPPDRVAG